MADTKILIIVVVYGCSPLETKTLSSLSHISFERMALAPSLVVWDNSASGYGAESLPRFAGEKCYCHVGGNISLAKVYNTVIANNDKHDWVIILDDDTVMSEKYFASLGRLLSSEINLGVPVVKYNSQVISPGRLAYIKGASFGVNEIKCGITKSKNFLAIMSGCVVRRNVFDSGILFDERLDLYGIDTRFLIDYQRKFSELMILDVVLDHDSALRSNSEPFEKRYFRLSNLIQSWPIVFGDSPMRKVLLYIYTALFIFKQAIGGREFRYLKMIKLLNMKFIYGNK